MGPGAAGGGQVRARLFLRPRGIRLEQRGTDAANERANRKRIARAAGRIRREGTIRACGSFVWGLQRARLHKQISGGCGRTGARGYVARGSESADASLVEETRERSSCATGQAKAAYADSYFLRDCATNGGR